FPDDVNLPTLYDGTQTLQGKKILILMLNGWGDMILIQPALRNFFNMICAGGTPPHITVACNWIRNFPYPSVPYIQDVRPNILTLSEYCSYDIVVNLIPAHFQRSAERSMRDLYSDLLHITEDFNRNDPPFLTPHAKKVQKLRPLFDQLRDETGKRILCVNWKSRFHHKCAPPELFHDIVTRLYDAYQPVVFKDEETSRIMQEEIRALNAPVINLSSLIYDYHDTIAALSLVDAVISVDTGIVHATGALGIPGVALFGPFPPETHVSDYTSILPVRSSYMGKTCLGPCCETHKGCADVNYSPEAVSPCFEAIDPYDVVNALEKLTDDAHHKTSISPFYIRHEKTSGEAAYGCENCV
ncbi:MAG: glycosyltransferase family 9 protein, partial [Deltaproteobacteria bacterium]|nr:glycosyltransferase family 9 protein [Deltaproteobacteria bacterium]